MKNFYQKKILIIKFGGLGDFFLSLNPFYTIRKSHSKDHIILLTQKPYNQIAKKTGWFDEILIIKRSVFYFLDVISIMKKINVDKIERVYDLQTSNRSSSYFRIFKNFNTEWSGIAKDCSHPHSNPLRNQMHSLDRFNDQLKYAGLSPSAQPSLNWILGEKFFTYKNYSLIVPGGSAKRQYKRLPKSFFNQIISNLIKKNIQPILIGADDELKLCYDLEKNNPSIVNLCSKLNIFDLAKLAYNSRIIFGNDTGTMHMFAMLNCNIVSLFTKHTNPKLCAPIGKKVKIINVESLDESTKSIIKIINNC